MKTMWIALAATVISMQIACSSAQSGPQTGGRVYYSAESMNDFEQRWCASHLYAMEEPILSPEGKSPDYFAFRLLYLPTWCRPLAIRYESDGDHAVRRAVMLSGNGGYDPGMILANHATSPQPREMADFLSSLEVSGYWTLAVKDKVNGFDGTQLIMETIRGGKHRVLVRWTPEYEQGSRGLNGVVALYTAEFKTNGFPTEMSE